MVWPIVVAVLGKLLLIAPVKHDQLDTVDPKSSMKFQAVGDADAVGE